MNITLDVSIHSLEALLLQELKSDLVTARENQDGPLERSLHIVIAYYSVPGTYMEGIYDGE